MAENRVTKAQLALHRLTAASTPADASEPKTPSTIAERISEKDFNQKLEEIETAAEDGLDLEATLGEVVDMFLDKIFELALSELEKLTQSVEGMNTRLDILEQPNEQSKARIAQLETRVTELEDRVTRLSRPAIKTGEPVEPVVYKKLTSNLNFDDIEYDGRLTESDE